jgi:hypothetical protein
MADIISKRVVGQLPSLTLLLIDSIKINDCNLLSLEKESNCLFFETNNSYLKANFFFKATIYQVDELMCDIVFQYEQKYVPIEFSFIIPNMIVDKITSLLIDKPGNIIQQLITKENMIYIMPENKKPFFKLTVIEIVLVLFFIGLLLFLFYR